MVHTRYKGDSGVWFEVFNEPYARKAATKPFPAAGENVPDEEYPWDLWSAGRHPINVSTRPRARP